MGEEVFYSQKGGNSFALERLEEFLEAPPGAPYRDMTFRPLSWDFSSSLREVEGTLLPSPGTPFIDEKGRGHLFSLRGQRPLLFSWKSSIHFWSSQSLSFQKHPLLRALGVRKGEELIDATCGRGQDSSFFLSMGLHTIAFERYRPLAFLLHFSQWQEKIENLEIYWGDISREKTREKGKIPIYYDPMFDDGKKRKARAKKSMDLFHKILPPPEDSAYVASELLKRTHRLVIKRPLKGPLLLEKPNAQWRTKVIRFDLYLS